MQIRFATVEFSGTDAAFLPLPLSLLLHRILFARNNNFCDIIIFQILNFLYFILHETYTQIINEYKFLRESRLRYDSNIIEARSRRRIQIFWKRFSMLLKSVDSRFQLAISNNLCGRECHQRTQATPDKQETVAHSFAR